MNVNNSKIFNDSELVIEYNSTLWTGFIENVIKHEDHSIQIIFGVLLIVIFIVGLIGNLLTCVVIYCDRTMHTATNYYLFNLALSDMFVAFGIILEVHERFTSIYPFEQFACKLHVFFISLFWNNSILIMTVLAVERYIAIWHPLLLKSTQVWRRVMKIILIVWVVAILETLPELWVTELIKTSSKSLCLMFPTKFARIVNGVLALFTFVIPLSIMTFVYIMIAFKVNVAQKANSRDRIFNYKNNSQKVNKLIALTVSFLVCWMPYFTIRVILFIFNMRQLIKHSEWWYKGVFYSSVNSWLSIVLNPILFSLMSTKFRRALKSLWITKVLKRTEISKNTTSRIMEV